MRARSVRGLLLCCAVGYNRLRYELLVLFHGKELNRVCAISMHQDGAQCVVVGRVQ